LPRLVTAACRDTGSVRSVFDSNNWAKRLFSMNRCHGAFSHLRQTGAGLPRGRSGV